MSQAMKKSTDNEKPILKADNHIDQTRGFSSADILQNLSSMQLLNTVVSKAIAQNLDSGVDKGLLKKLTNGKYEVNETARRRKSRSRSRSRAKPKRRSRSRKRSRSRRRRRSSSGRRRKRSSSGRRRKRSTSGRRRKRSTSGRRRKRSTSGRRRKRSTSGRRRSRRRTKASEEQI